MSRRVSFGIVLATAFYATPALAGWNGAEWGMTPPEVEQATLGFARATRDDLPREGRDPVTGARASFENELSDFEVRYRFDHGGLMRIELKPELDDCSRVAEDFQASFGVPQYHEQAILRTFVWEDEENDNRIVLLHSVAEVCTFTFGSLSKFRERQAAKT